MKKIAIVGAGFAGVALAYYLLEKGGSVTLFDKKGIGAGASGAATGLLHPYPGAQGRYSLNGHEALAKSLELLCIARQKVVSGILRYCFTEQLEKNLLRHGSMYGDVERVSSTQFLIKSGVSVSSLSYLESLWKVCETMGGQLLIQEVELPLKGFDEVVIAAGAGCRKHSFLSLSAVKGQALICKRFLQQSLIGKGYAAPGEEAGTCVVGSTYERDDLSEQVCVERAIEQLQEPFRLFFPNEEMHVVGCRAGVRVRQRGSYLPLVKRIEKGLWVFTGLGSRGLLYHAYFASQLAAALL